MRQTDALSLGGRAACAVAAYVFYGIAATLLAPTIVAYTQAHGITSFYELAPDEAPGPLGNINQALFNIGVEYALFVLMVTPVFLWLGGFWWLYLAFLVFNAPLLLSGLVIFLRLTGR